MPVDISLFVAAVLVVADVLAFEFVVSTAITEIAAIIQLGSAADVSGLTWLDLLSHYGMLGQMLVAGFEVGIGLYTTSPSFVEGLIDGALFNRAPPTP